MAYVVLTLLVVALVIHRFYMGYKAFVTKKTSDRAMELAVFPQKILSEKHILQGDDLIAVLRKDREVLISGWINYDPTLMAYVAHLKSKIFTQ